MARDVTKLSYVQISVSLYGLVIVSRASKGPYSTVIGTLMGGAVTFGMVREFVTITFKIRKNKNS